MMDIFIKEEENLSYSWHPGCHFMGLNSHGKANYTVGPIGRIGPGSTVPWTTPSLPSSLIFNITFKNTQDVNLYENVVKVLDNLANDDKIEVIKNKPMLIITKLGVKR